MGVIPLGLKKLSQVWQPDDYLIPFARSSQRSHAASHRRATELIASARIWGEYSITLSLKGSAFIILIMMMPRGHLDSNAERNFLCCRERLQQALRTPVKFLRQSLMSDFVDFLQFVQEMISTSFVLSIPS